MSWTARKTKGAPRNCRLLLLFKERLIGQLDSIRKRRGRAPAQFGEAGDIEQFTRRTVGPRGVEADPTDIANGRRDHAGEFGDRDVFAGADVDQFVARID